MEVNLFILYALVTRILSIFILLALVLPRQWSEMMKQWRQKENINTDEYYRLAFTLLLIVMSTVVFSIVPVGYQLTRIDSQSSLDLQNLSSFFTNTVILLQSFGWYMIYKNRK